MARRSAGSRLRMRSGRNTATYAEDLSKAAAGLRHLAANGKIPPPLAVLDDMLGFYGARTDKSPPVLPASAVERLKRLSAKKPPRYLSPGNIIDMPGLPKDSVRVHVLGPPRQHDLLYRANPRADESYDHKLTARIASARKFLKAVGSLRGMRSREDKREENDYPFTHTLKCNANKSAALAKMQEDYDNRQNRWRKIDRRLAPSGRVARALSRHLHEQLEPRARNRAGREREGSVLRRRRADRQLAAAGPR